MKRKNIFSWLFPVTVAVLAGCGRESADSAKTDAPVVFGPQHNATKGLLVPENTRQSLGLKIIEVAEQNVPSGFDVQLLVYQVGDQVSRASGRVTPEQAKHLKAGQPVEVRSGNGQSIAAKVTGMSEQLLNATGVLELLVEIPQTPEEFKVGTFVQARVTLAEKKAVVTVPQKALIQSCEGQMVYTVSGEYLVRTLVVTGAATDEFVEIKEGLYAGDQIVLEPVMSLWMTELAAVKGGQACCVEPAKGK